MIKVFVFVSAILVSIFPAYEGLTCYHCYMDSKYGMNDYKLNRCNEQNMTASDTMVCPDPKSMCIYEVVESDFLAPQVWRTCSDPKYNPCDKRAVPNGMKMLDCSYCGTDRCNLKEGKKPEQNSYTFNINANVSVSIE